MLSPWGAVRMKTISPDDFRRQIAQCLGHFYDTAYLETCPLSKLLLQAGAGVGAPGEFLRKTLWGGVQALRPPDGTTSDDVAWRAYRILDGRYLAGLSNAELQDQLGLSRTQYYREHARAIDALASLLWRELESQVADDSAQDPLPQTPTTPAVAELAILASQEGAETLDVGNSLREISALLKAELGRQPIETSFCTPSGPMWTVCSPTILRQSLLGAISWAMSSLESGRISVTGRLAESQVRIEIVGQGVLACDYASKDLSTVQDFVKMAGGTFGFGSTSDSLSIEISLPGSLEKRVVLLVDNSQELASLFAKYLVGQPWSLLHSSSVTEALEICRHQKVSVILLDLLMPHQDGWQFLPMIKAATSTRSIPVVVCSILSQPKLALALGASGYLQKPVTREALLRVLRPWGPTSAG